MPNALIPELNGRQLTVDVALRSPSIIRAQIARLADSQLLLPRLFRTYGNRLDGGGLLYSVITASDFYSSDIELRAPGTEYRVVEGVDPDVRLAPVEDWGGKFVVPQEVITRNQVNYLDQQTTQLANTIARKLDSRAITVVEAASPASIAVATPWDELVTVGPEADLTPSASRPTGSFAEAQELADLDELGVTLDTLLVHPSQSRALKTAYGPDLAAVLESAGLTMYANPRIANGTAYVVEGGQVGTVAFESAGLVVDTWEDKATRSWIVQAYAVPALAVDRPYAAKKLTALS